MEGTSEDIMGDWSATRALELDDAAEWGVSCAVDEWAWLVGTRPDDGD